MPFFNELGQEMDDNEIEARGRAIALRHKADTEAKVRAKLATSGTRFSHREVLAMLCDRELGRLARRALLRR